MNNLTTVLGHVANNASNAAVNTIIGGDGIIGIGLVLICFFLSMLVTWVILRTVLVVNGAKPRTANEKTVGGTPSGSVEQGPTQLLPGEGFLTVRLETILLALSAAVLAYAKGALNAFSEALTWLVGNWLFLLGLFILAAGFWVWLIYHDVLLEVAFEIIQCDIRPTLDGTVLPLVSTLRVLFALVWPVVNAFTDIHSALIFGNLQTLVYCTPVSLGKAVALRLFDGIVLLAQSFAYFMGFGLLSSGRWDMLPGLAVISEAINMTREIGDCYCLDAAPFWDFFYGVAISPTLSITIDCAANTIIAFWQIPLNAIIFLQAPNTSAWAEEATCAVFGVGDYAEDIFLLFIEFLIGVIELAEVLMESVEHLGSSVLFARVAAMHAVADVTLHIPPVLLHMQSTPGAVLMRPLGLLWMAAANDAIRSAHGDAHRLFNFAPTAGADRVEEETVQKLNGASLVDPSVNDFIIAALGLDALLRVANTPWSKMFTAPVAVLIGAFNLTVNAVSHPILSFTEVGGIAFFQYGLMGDYTRMALNAIVELLSLFNVALPCTFSKPIQAIGSIPQSFVEFLTGAAFGWAFPPWAMGVPPPINCSEVNCTKPAPPNWSVLDVFAQYYAWNGSRMRENLILLEEGGECTAFLLGCNTTADNNNSTNITSNCTDAPLACTARGLNRAVVATLNLTLALIFYFPDLVRFDANYSTFADLPIVEAQLAFEDFNLCLGLFLDELDISGDRCMTETAPDPRPDNPNVTREPDDSVGVYTVPPRTEWECRLNGGAFYWDGRQVVVLNSTDIFQLNETQFACLITDSRECAIAISESVEVLGSAPEDNVTLVVYPGWVEDAGAQALILVYNATTGTSELALPNASILLSVFNVTNVVESDCTHLLPVPPMLGPQYLCYLDPLGTYQSTYGSVFGQYIESYSSAYGVTVSEPVSLPCEYTLPSNVYCDSGELFINDTAVGGVRQIFFQNNSNFGVPAFDSPVTCTGTVPALPHGISCRYNALVRLLHIPLIHLPPNISLYQAVHYYPDAPFSSDAQFVPCENIPPPDYTCELDGGVYKMHTAGEVITASDPDFNFTCTVNPLEQDPPVCTQIFIEYVDGQNVTIELEGGEVRVYSNDEQEAVPCTYQDVDMPGINTTGDVGISQATVTFLAAADAARPVTEEGVNFRKKIEYAQARVWDKFARRDAHIQEPVATPIQLANIREQGDFILDRLSATEQGRAQIPHFLRLMSIALHAANVTVFRKETFICCLSEVVTASGEFIIAFVFQVLILAQGILTLPAIPDYPVPVPTFTEARDALRYALCKLGCTLTGIFPFTLSCPGVGSDGTNGTACDDFAQCGRNFLCDLFDIPVLLADFIVDLLVLISALSGGTAPPTGENSILGPTCSANSPSDCIVSFLIYVVTDATLTATMVLRTGATVLDCIFCALAQSINPHSPCVSGFFIVVGAICDIVDGLVKSILPPLLNFVVGVVEFWVYLFGGQFAQMWNVLSTKILASIYQMIAGLGNLIISFLLRLPIIGKIVQILVNIVQGACTTLNWVITHFGGHNLGCNSITAGGKKRGIVYTGWLAGVWSNVTYVWEHEAAASCSARMSALNNTDYPDITEDTTLTREVLYCMAAHLYVGPTATPEMNQVIASECDLIMPGMYTNGYTWSSLDSMTQSRALTCVKARLDAETVRSDAGYSGSWFPHDFFNNMGATLLPLLDDTVLAYNVWSQYATDRLIPAGQLVSSEYRGAWAARGYSVAHLETLAARVHTSAQAYDALDTDPSLTLQAYVDRAVNGSTPPGIARALLGRNYSSARIGGLIRALIQPVMNGTGSGIYDTETGEEMSLTAHVMQQAFDEIEGRLEYMTTSVPLTASIVPRLFAASEPRLLTHTMSGLVDVFVLDVPALLVRLVRTPGRLYTSMKRALPDNAPPLPLYFYNVVMGAFTLVKEIITGQATRTHQWMAQNGTREWLAAEAIRGRHHNFKETVGGAWIPNPRTVVGHLVQGVGALLRPLAHTTNGWARLMDLALDDTTESSVGARRVAMSRLGARIMLMTAVGGDHVVYERAMATAGVPRWARSAEVNNATGLTCMFAVANGTSLNTSVGNITYPLCETCLGLDQVFGRVQRAAYNLVYFFGASTPTCPGCAHDLYPSLNYTMTQYQLAYDYLTDPTATVVVGYSALGPVPVGYPSQNFSAYTWWDDPTPDKTGFTDLEALLNATWAFIHHALDSSVSDNTLLSATTVSEARLKVSSAGVDLTGSKLPAQDLLSRLRAKEAKYVRGADLGPIHQPVYELFSAVWALFAPSVTASTANGTVGASTIDVGTGPFTTVEEVARAWIAYFLSFFLCPWQELSFNGKRFSIGYLLIYGFWVLIIFAAIGQAVSPGNLILVIFTSVFITFPFVFASGIVVTYEYGYFCMPALPLGLGDDVMYFIVYSLLSKCGIGYGVVNEPYYNNENCYACSHWRDGWFTVPNFHTAWSAGGRFGFSDIRYNIAFILRAAFPTIYWALRPGGSVYTTRGVSLVLASSFFQTPLAAYEWFEPTQVTATEYRQFWQGGTWVTGIPNMFIALAALYLLFRALWPFISQTLGFLEAVFLIVLPLLLFLFTGVFVFASFDMDEPMAASSPAPTPKKKKEEEEKEEELMDATETLQMGLLV